MKRVVLDAAICNIDGTKRIAILDKKELDAFKKKCEVGERLTAEFRTRDETASDKAMRLFHELRDRMANEQGLDKEQCKRDLKLAFGVTLTLEEEAKQMRPGIIYETPQETVFLVSLIDYRTGEINPLIKGTINACMDAQVDIEDIMQEMDK